MVNHEPGGIVRGQTLLRITNNGKSYCNEEIYSNIELIF